MLNLEAELTLSLGLISIDSGSQTSGRDGRDPLQRNRIGPI